MQQIFESDITIDDADSRVIQELLDKIKEKLQYFTNIDLDIIQQWVTSFEECQNLLNYNQLNQEKQNTQLVQATLQQLHNDINIIKTEGITLVGKFKPWMSGVGMIDFPLGYKIYGQIEFGILNGRGVMVKKSNGMKLIGTFVKNELQGRGTIVMPNHAEIIGQFVKGKMVEGSTQIKYLNNSQYKVQTDLTIHLDQFKFQNVQFENQNGNIQYYTEEFSLGQQSQRNYRIQKNQTLLQEYKDGELINGQGFIQLSENTFLYGIFQNRILNGQGQVRDGQNRLLKAGQFKNNQLIHGQKYDPQNFNLFEQGDFMDDCLEGEGQRFCVNSNQIYEKGNFRRGVLDGRGIRYQKSSELIHEDGHFQNGLLHGEEGVRYCTREDIDSQGHQLEQRQKEIGQFQNGQLIDGTKFYYNGNIAQKGKFNQHGLVGEGEKRHENGFIQEYGIFQDGKLHSEDEKSGRASDNGVLIEIGYFLNGELKGVGEKYYPSKRKKEIGTFENGKLCGRGIRYYDNENNSIQEEGNFQDGKLHGDQIGKQYYKDRSIRSHGLYQNGLLTTTDGAIYFNDYEMRGVFRNGQANGSVTLYNLSNNMRFESNEQSNEAFLRNARNHGVYLSNQFNTNAERSLRRD